ncbi:MAG: mechanosensitive ion channel [Kastovskya adunca ATA6-11-RM4]|jgi:small-conductance mechanosensitive channel|nr:mechanosensitive ion channel [Kastovskya adunca ATA6-11-RM4]
MNRFLRFQSLLSRILQLIIVAVALGFILIAVPALAQRATTAPVTLDGRRLFDVSQSGQYTAQERAAEANRFLRGTIQADEPVRVEIEERQDLPVILINGGHLLSVTSADAPPGRTIEEQAIQWRRELQVALARAQRERSVEYLTQKVLISIGCLLLALALSWVLSWIWQHWLQPLLPAEIRESNDSQPSKSVKKTVQVILSVIRAAIWFATTLYITNLFPQTREWSRSVVDSITFTLTSPFIPLGQESYSVLDILILIGLFVGLFVLTRTAKKLLRSRVLNLTGLSRGSQETIAVVANYSLIFIGTIVVLQIWGLDLSTLAIFASVLGVGVGLGLQGIAKEFISGLVVIFERPIQVGDFVELGELLGTVERIGVRSTEIVTLDDLSIIVPNSRFLESEVINWTHRTPIARLRLPVGVAYGSNSSAVRIALIDAVKEHPDVLSEPTPKVFFEGFGESSLKFNLLIWICEPRKQFRIKSDIYFRIEAILRNREIEIPFPQQDLHVRSGSLPIELSPQLAESLSRLSDGLEGWLKHQTDMAMQDNRNGKGKTDKNQHGD